MPSEKHLDPPSQPIPFFSAGTKIPKIIHQIYFHPHQNLPAVLQENVRAIRGLNPGWEHRLYDDHDMAEFITTIPDPVTEDMQREFHAISGHPDEPTDP